VVSDPREQADRDFARAIMRDGEHRAAAAAVTSPVVAPASGANADLEITREVLAIARLAAELTTAERRELIAQLSARAQK